MVTKVSVYTNNLYRPIGDRPVLFHGMDRRWYG